MANGIESFSEKRQLAQVAEGMKGGPFFSDPVTVPVRKFVDGYPASVSEKLKEGTVPQSTPLDPWVVRRSGSNLK